MVIISVTQVVVVVKSLKCALCLPVQALILEALSHLQGKVSVHKK